MDGYYGSTMIYFTLSQIAIRRRKHYVSLQHKVILYFPVPYDHDVNFFISAHDSTEYHTSKVMLSWFEAQAFCETYSTKNNLVTFMVDEDNTEDLINTDFEEDSDHYWTQMSALVLNTSDSSGERSFFAILVLNSGVRC